MPMPKPKKNEDKQGFVSRCIATLSKDEKDKWPSSKQRAAICYSEWGETPAEKQAAEKKAARRSSSKGSTKSKAPAKSKASSKKK